MPTRHQPTADQPEFQLDLDPDRRKAFVAQCNERLAAARARHIEHSLEGGGIEGCRILSAEVDALLKSVYDWLAEETRLEPDSFGRIAIVAQGGYGQIGRASCRERV